MSLKRYLKALGRLIQREPVRTFAVIRSLSFVIAAFWPNLITPNQQAALLGLTVAWLGIDEVVRQQVTPVAQPVVPEGTKLTITTPAGVPDRVVST